MADIVRHMTIVLQKTCRTPKKKSNSSARQAKPKYVVHRNYNK